MNQGHVPPPSGHYGYQVPQYHQQPGYGPGGYGYGGPPMIPRDHPSGTGILLMGIGSIFCFGALMGVPAILWGRSVVSAAEREPARWRSPTSAKIGIGLGWASVAETAFFVSMKMTHSTAAGAACAGVGAVGLTLLALGSVKSLPKPVAVVAGTLRRAPLAVGLVLAGMAFGGAAGVSSVSAAHATEVAKCDGARGVYADAIKNDNGARAHAALPDLQSYCHMQDAELAPMRAKVDAMEADQAKRVEAAAKAKVAADAAQREATAVASFPAESKAIDGKLKKAQQAAWQGRWEDSSEILGTAQTMLDAFKGTSVEESKDYTTITKQIATQRKAIQPQLDKIEEKRRQEAAAAALRAAIRGPQPQNSAWDGSIYAIERAVKRSMHDPDSYEHVRTTPASIEGDYWVAVSAFRGKNVFGAKVVNMKKFYIQQGVVVKVSDVAMDDD